VIGNDVFEIRDAKVTTVETRAYGSDGTRIKKTICEAQIFHKDGLK